MVEWQPRISNSIAHCYASGSTDRMNEKKKIFSMLFCDAPSSKKNCFIRKVVHMVHSCSLFTGFDIQLCRDCYRNTDIRRYFVPYNFIHIVCAHTNTQTNILPNLFGSSLPLLLSLRLCVRFHLNDAQKSAHASLANSEISLSFQLELCFRSHRT